MPDSNELRVGNHNESLKEILPLRMQKVLTWALNLSLSNFKAETVDPRAEVLTRMGLEMLEEQERLHTYDIRDLTPDLLIELDNKATMRQLPVISMFKADDLLYPVAVQSIPQIQLAAGQKSLITLDSSNVSEDLIRNNATIMNTTGTLDSKAAPTNILLVMTASFMSFWQTVHEIRDTINRYPNLPVYTMQAIHPFFHQNTGIDAAKSLGIIGNTVPVSNAMLQYGPRLVNKKLDFDPTAEVTKLPEHTKNNIIKVRSKQIFLGVHSAAEKSFMGVARFVTKMQYDILNIFSKDNVPSEIIIPVSSLAEERDKIQQVVDQFKAELPKIKEG